MTYRDNISFAEFCEQLDEEEKERQVEESNSRCQYSSNPSHRKKDCNVISPNALKDVCRTCGKIWRY